MICQEGGRSSYQDGNIYLSCSCLQVNQTKYWVIIKRKFISFLIRRRNLIKIGDHFHLVHNNCLMQTFIDFLKWRFPFDFYRDFVIKSFRKFKTSDFDIVGLPYTIIHLPPHWFDVIICIVIGFHKTKNVISSRGCYTFSNFISAKINVY